MPRRSNHSNRPRRPICSSTRNWKITQADCLDHLPTLDADTFDSVITDPPYGISINGMTWDRPAQLDPAAAPGRRRPRAQNPNERFQEFSRAWSSACLRSLKPGGHLAAFAAPRTVHRLTCGLEEAGYEIRDVLMWLQGQGFPATRLLPDGLGTGLKPAWEPIVLARKPLSGTLVQNLANYGTGAINVDASRIAVEDCPAGHRAHRQRGTANLAGRWPTNVLLSHGEECSAERCEPRCPVGALGDRRRFFYCAKPPRRERDAGCEQLPRRTTQTFHLSRPQELERAKNHPVANFHPTVKPIDLMRWLIRLLTPAGGYVLDPFAGSGGTGAAAVLESARFHGIERDASYVPVARARITHWSTRRPGCTTAGARPRRKARA